MWLWIFLVQFLSSLSESVSVSVKVASGFIIADIITEIQQNVIGQYNDVEYLLSLTAIMTAL